jgi:hypothetical protein
MSFPLGLFRQAMIDEFDLDQDGEINLDVSSENKSYTG